MLDLAPDALTTDAAFPKRKKLDFLWLEITNRCNLECVHCYTSSSPKTELTGKLALADWKALIADAQESGCERVQIIGGEPMVHPHFDEILFDCARAFASVEVFTNATSLSDRRADYMAMHGVTLATSIYSGSAETHDKVTGRRGSHAQTISNLRKAIAKGIEARVGFIVTDDNSKEDFDALRTWLMDMGVKYVGRDTARAIGRGETQTVKIGDCPETAICGACWAGNLCATYAGSIHPCIMSKHVTLGRVSDGIQSALMAKSGIKERQLQLEPTMCSPQHHCFPKGERCTPTEHCLPR